ncbi:lipoprotein [Kaistia sp. 32K]|uniref:MetQ/NlpA family ABC transporter substrate-binding protein n=1 Tax=Kaistia sp. 32K TaxID=2795690 RepID=UPI00191621D0|nr:MetQ/NlpA family ABC transporter substrate-binding protein [Kaistia sp. 32K]BCP55495.1 lipoprotein [Kaistia sp. 32K]
MVSRRQFFGLGISLAIGLGIAGAAGPSFADEKPLRIGLATSIANDAVRHAAQLAEQQGLKVQIIEFTDWVTPNSALANGDVDVNYFQHIPFLENAAKANGWNFTPVAPGYNSVSGIYSEKLKSLDDIKDGSTVTIANDPINTGRALLFLQAQGLIKLKDGADFRATLLDVVENPKNLKFVQVEAQQVVRSLPDVDFVVSGPSFIKLAGKDPDSALVFEKPDNVYAMQWVTRAEDAKDPRLAKFIQVYENDPEVKPLLTKLYNGHVTFAW